jgi:hypothetical protein
MEKLQVRDEVLTIQQMARVTIFQPSRPKSHIMKNNKLNKEKIANSSLIATKGPPYASVIIWGSFHCR